MFPLRRAQLVLSSLMAGMTLATLTTMREPYQEIMEHMDTHIADENHDLRKPLHPTYVDNLKAVGSGAILLLHDTQGNIDESTYHYMALKMHELYEILSTFLTTHELKKPLGETTSVDMLYITHRNLMRFNLGYLTLEMYMTLLYKSRQEALERLDAHYPSNTRREIIQRAYVRNNFNQQFTKLMANLRTLMSQQMVYSEKTFYWSSRLTEEEGAALSKSDMSGLLKVQRYQNVLSANLAEFDNMLKAKRKFYMEHVLPEELAEQERNKLGQEEANE